MADHGAESTKQQLVLSASVVSTRVGFSLSAVEGRVTCHGRLGPWPGQTAVQRIRPGRQKAGRLKLSPG